MKNPKPKIRGTNASLRTYSLSISLTVLFCFLGIMQSPGSAVSEDPQQYSVSGRITDRNTGESLPGVNIVVEGTISGTISDGSGRYTIQVPNRTSVLVFTFIGYVAERVPVNGQSNLDVSLLSDVMALDEVVVTALGISREKKSLGYSVAEVKGDALQKVAQENVLNSLAGKVAGVAINSTGTAGSSVSMVIRGASSLTSDNQPLFVVDGIPMNNTLNNVQQMGRDNRADYGNAISDLNPEDFESVSILKGPSAAALYGSRAGNGVVLITTKSGSQKKGLGVTFSTNTVIEQPYKYLPLHHSFANGIYPYTESNRPNNNLPYMLINAVDVSWMGPELDKGIMAYQWPYFNAEGVLTAQPLVSYPDNYKEFFQTGYTTTNSIAVSDATEKIDYRLSFTNMLNKGIIPNSDLKKNSVSLTSTFKLNEKIKITTSLNYTNSGSKNRPAGNRGANPMQAAYEINPSIDFALLEDYWEPGKQGLQQKMPYQLIINPDGTYRRSGTRNNPYFLANEINNSFQRDRFYGNAVFDYQITKEFSFMARYTHDQYSELRETKMAPSYSLEPYGFYGLANLGRKEQNADFLFTYNKRVGDFNMTASAGGNYMFTYDSDYLTKCKDGGSGLVIPGIYSISNISISNLQYSSSWSKKSIRSLYALASLGYKDLAYLDLTARNDWSSTLPEENRSYFYPSASLSVLLNNVIEMGDKISLAKLRAGIAMVGNDTDPYRLKQVMGNYGAWGNITRLGSSGTLLLPDLKPEIKTSWEFGADLAFFQNSLRFEGTYYSSENKNQILSIGLPQSSGYSGKLINAGLISSKGIELSIGGTPFTTKDLTWDVNFVFSKNKTIIEELAPGFNYFTLWTDARGGAITWVGEEIGQIVDAKMLRVEDENSQYYGWPIVDEEGWDLDDRTLEKDGKRVAPVIGNFNPDFTLGMQTSLRYKKWSVSASFDWRKGGQFVSQTERYGGSDMHQQRLIDIALNLKDVTDIPAYLKANADKYLLPNDELFYVVVGGNTQELGGFPINRGGLTTYNGAFMPGVVGDYDENGNFIATRENLGGAGTVYNEFAGFYGWNYTRTATFDADFIKLREISISYDLPSLKSIGIQNASFSIYSRNIILWTKAKICIDPETAFQPEGSAQGSGIQFKQGIERYNITPWTIPIGFKLNVSF